MTTAAAWATVATVGGAGATVAGVHQSRQAAQDGREANRAEANRVQVEQARNIRRAVAASRVQQAQAQAMGVQSGVADGSGVAGAVVGTGAATGAGIGHANQVQSLQMRSFQAQRSQMAAQSRSSMYAAGATALGGFSQFQAPGEGSFAGMYNMFNHYFGGSE